MAAGFFDRPDWRDRAGLHAFIVGISAYANLPPTAAQLKPEHFGMTQLASPALTAFRLAKLLKERASKFAVPVATVRLLVAPSVAELAAEPALAGFAQRPDFGNFSKEAKAWRVDACSDPRGRTLFYFAGHGLQRVNRDHVLVLDNFNDGQGGRLSQKGLVVNHLIDGMAASAGQENVAQTQVYLFDTCNVLPDLLKESELPNTGDLWDVNKVPAIDERTKPSIFASKPGTVAFAKPGVETLYGGALIKCLAGGAGVPEDDDLEAPNWVVTLGSLREAMRRCIDRANQEEGAAQDTDAQNISSDDVLLLRLDERPDVDVTLRIDPIEAAQATRVSVVDAADTALRELAMFASNQLSAGEVRLLAVMDPEDARLRPLARRRLFIRPPLAQPTLKFDRR